MPTPEEVSRPWPRRTVEWPKNEQHMSRPPGARADERPNNGCRCPADRKSCCAMCTLEGLLPEGCGSRALAGAQSRITSCACVRSHPSPLETARLRNFLGPLAAPLLAKMTRIEEDISCSPSLRRLIHQVAKQLSGLSIPRAHERTRFEIKKTFCHVPGPKDAGDLCRLRVREAAGKIRSRAQQTTRASRGPFRRASSGNYRADAPYSTCLKLHCRSTRAPRAPCACTCAAARRPRAAVTPATAPHVLLVRDYEEQAPNRRRAAAPGRPRQLAARVAPRACREPPGRRPRPIAITSLTR